MVIRYRHRNRFTFILFFFIFFSSPLFSPRTAPSSPPPLLFFVLNSRDSPSSRFDDPSSDPRGSPNSDPDFARSLVIPAKKRKEKEPDETKTVETKTIRYFHRFHTTAAKALFFKPRVESRFVETARTCGKL